MSDLEDQAARERAHAGRFFRALAWTGVGVVTGWAMWHLDSTVFVGLLIGLGVVIFGGFLLGVLWEATR